MFEIWKFKTSNNKTLDPFNQRYLGLIQRLYSESYWIFKKVEGNEYKKIKVARMVDSIVR